MASVETDQTRLAAKKIDGSFQRRPTKFHGRISADGPFKPEANRYHLYVSKACPWCHRVLLLIALKGLDKCISVANTDPYLRNLSTKGSDKELKESEQYIGWEFNEKYPDSLYPNAKSVWDIYKKHDPNYSNKDSMTVPILFDKKTEKIVNNESAELIEILNSEFNEFAANPKLDLSPKDEQIQKAMKFWNDELYPNLNDGVYRTGFARSQEAHNAAFDGLVYILEKLEKHLAENRYLCGALFTLSDIRAFVTLIRFDAVYYVHFKCNYKQIRELPNLWNYTREIYQMKGVKETVDMEYTKLHYYHSHRSINPLGIVAKGPAIDFDEPHTRDKMKKN